MRRWYELRGHAMQGRSIKMTKSDYSNGLLEELLYAIKVEEIPKIERALKEEYNRLEAESYKYAAVKKKKKKKKEAAVEEA